VSYTTVLEQDIADCQKEIGSNTFVWDMAFEAYHSKRNFERLQDAIASGEFERQIKEGCKQVPQRLVALCEDFERSQHMSFSDWLQANVPANA
jgi:hypothetical protein